MKKLIAILIILNIALGIMFASAEDKTLKDTTINSITYHLYIGSHGGKYILKTSKSGTTYKRYFKH